MAIEYNNPKIVTDGLVLALDAANPKSYPGSGTTWSDLAGNNDATLTNGPTFDSGNSGSFVFDGIDDYADSGNPSISDGKLTVNAWIKISAGSIYQHIVDSSSNSWHLAILNTNKPYFYNGSTFHTAALTLTVGEWYMLTGVQGTTLDVYVNGGLSQSIASNVNVTTNNVYIGRWQSPNPRPYAGSIA